MAEIKALFFDQDGVIADTERDGHRVAFNETFKHFGVPLQWSEDYYHTMLQIGGGKERMLHDIRKHKLYTDDPDEKVQALVQEMHLYKTGLFIRRIRERRIPLRPGIDRIMRQVNQLGLVLGICTTSTEEAANAIRENLLGHIRLDFLLAGDCVSRKKPDPEIYLKALDKARIRPEEGLVFEDSRVGVEAATAAGLSVIATVNGYTKDEDLQKAEWVVTSLGDSGEKSFFMRGDPCIATGGQIELEPLLDYFRRRRP